MRILYDYQIFSNPHYGGIARYFIELSKRIGRYPGVDLKVVSPLSKSAFLSNVSPDVPFLGIDASKYSFLKRSVVFGINRQLFSGFAQFARPDLVHETYYASQWKPKQDCKVITTIHDLIPEIFHQYFPGHDEHRRQKKEALAKADHIICVSESTRRDLFRFYDIAEEKVTVVPLGSAIGTDEQVPAPDADAYFLHVGGRYEYKNFDGLIRAFGRSKLYMRYRLVSFSSRPLEQREYQVMKEAGVPIESVVHMTGDDAKLAQCYARATALVFPSLYEGFGIPLLEAMRCRCAVITSNTSSMPEVAGDAALYCNPNDVDSIAEAMALVASSNELRNDLIARGSRRVAQFSWDRCAEQTFEVYRSALHS